MKDLKRKSFHLIGLIYIAGIYFIPRELFFVILSSFLVISFGIEIARLKSSSFQKLINSFFSDIIKKEEINQFTGVFWMILGVLFVTLFLNDKTLSMVCVAYLIFGDTAANLGGKAFNGPKWPGSKKRVLGSAACFIVCALVGFVLLRQASWISILLGAGVATLLEIGVFKLDDNFLIPAGSALWFLVWYNLYSGIIFL